MAIWSRVMSMAVVMGSLAWHGAAMAQEEGEADFPITAALQLDYASKYIWRGIEVNDEPVLQPSVTLSAAGFSFNAWGNYDLTDGGREDNFSEYDYTLKYATKLDDEDKLAFEVGAIEYYFPPRGAGNDTQEAFVTLGYDCLLAPTVSVFYDFGEVHGFYGQAGIGHTFVLDEEEERLKLNLGAKIGYATTDYNAGYFGVNKNGLNDGVLSAGLSYAVTEKFTVAWTLLYSELLDSEIEDAVNDGGGDSDNAWTVWSVAYTF